VAARADDEQISAPGFLDENGGGRTLVDATLDRYAVCIGADVRQSLVERGLGAPAKVLQLPADSGKRPLETGRADVAELPGVDDAQRRLPQPRLLEREPQRCLGSGRVVDTDNDYAPDSLLSPAGVAIGSASSSCQPNRSRATRGCPSTISRHCSSARCSS
jgi:hypothetical protein